MQAERLAFLTQLDTIIRQRIDANPGDSYTASLAAAGTKRVAQKTGEEALEVALAAVAGDAREVCNEAADLLYHLLVLLALTGTDLTEVVAELQRRHTES